MAGAKVKLAKLEKVADLRQVWSHEVQNFTKWLCEEDGIDLLGAELGIDIAVDETESGVGVYRADVLAHEERNGRRIVIENQLGETDHDHLGKLLVYAAGKTAEIVVWIVKKARDEHRRAIEWLNEHTDQGIGFFLVEVELWKIGDSAPAVRFNAVERPNEWAQVQKTSELSDVKQLQLRFWSAFREHAEGRPEMKAAFSFRKPLPRSYYDMAVGRLSFLVSHFVHFRKARVQAALYFQREGREFFAEFRTREAEIKAALDAGDIAWKEAELYECFSVQHHAELEDESSWPAAFDWLCAMSLRLKELALKFGRPAQAEPEGASGGTADALPEGMPGSLQEDDEEESEGEDGDEDVGREQDPVVAVREDWHELRLVPDAEKTAEMCMDAVRQCGIALRFVPDRLKTPELCMAAVKWDDGFLD
ncbi:MAG: DUF4268 domain-containing protein [Desulfovibrio sp.]|nr:DUF4268 domain-containing protein [Desulfovibrio sp.]